MKRRSWVRLALLAILAAVLPACGKKSGSSGSAPPPPPPPAPVTESESNDTSATSDALLLNQLGQGSLAAAGDVDFWAVALSGGSLVRVEIFAGRVDQASWNATGNAVELTVFDTDGTTPLTAHDDFLWGWGNHDWDIPCVRIPADGTYFVRAAQALPGSAGGLYGLRVQIAGIDVTQTEAEAGAGGTNDTPGTAEALVGTSGIVRGFHVDDESDYYSFAVLGPTIVRLEMLAYRNGIFAGDDEYYDPALEILDTDGATVMGTNDDREFYDSGMHFRTVGTGTYYVHVDECCDAGDGEYFLIFSFAEAPGFPEAESNDAPGTATPIAYDTTVTSVMAPGDADYFSFTGVAGDMVRVHLFDMGRLEGAADEVTVAVIGPDGLTVLPSDFGGPGGRTLRTILQASGTYFVLIAPDGTPAVTDYAFLIERFKGAAFEVEANGSIATANPLDGDNRAAGVIGVPADVDFFSFAATAGNPVLVVVYADNSPGNGNAALGFNGHGSELDPVVTVMDGASTVIGIADAGLTAATTESVLDGLPIAQVAFVPSASGTYYVRIGDSGGLGGAGYTYVVERR